MEIERWREETEEGRIRERKGVSIHFWVRVLESLHAVTRLGILSDNVKDGVDELSSFGVVSLSLVVTGSGLSEDEVVRSEKLKWSGTDGVHGSWLKIHKESSWDISSSGSFVGVDVDSLQLKIGISVVGTGWVDSVLVGLDLPELGTDLVTALSSLNVNVTSHVCIVC